MDEHCVFCGAHIPDDAAYCQDCAPFVERLDHDRRRALDALLADKKDRETFRKNWEQLKECMAMSIQIVIEMVNKVADWLMEYRNQQEEGEA